MSREKKVFLRPIKQTDLEYLNKWKNDETTFKFLGGGFKPISIDQQANWMQSMMDLTGNNKRFIICNGDYEPIGMVGLYSINWIHRTTEVGLYIGNHEFRGKGLATEAFKIIEEYAINYLNLRKIKLNVVKSNEKAINLWNRLGFDTVGELFEERYIDGSYYNLVIMEKMLSK